MKEQLSIKKRDYEFVSLDTLYNYLISGTLSKKVLVITFDDGYVDNYDLAYPILKKYQIPFAIYVTTGILNNTAILWWYLLEDLVRDNEEIKFRWNKKSHIYYCSNNRQKEEVYSQIQNFIHKNFYIESIEELFCELFKLPSHEFYSHTIPNGMTWEQVIELSKDPLVTIGAHTENHFPLAKLSRRDAMIEIEKSKTELEHRLEQPVEHFAYPYGKFIHANYRDYEIVKKLGFKTATTTEIGNLFLHNSSSLNSLPRININSVSDNDVLDLQTSGLLSFIINRGKLHGK